MGRTAPGVSGDAEEVKNSDRRSEVLEMRYAMIALHVFRSPDASVILDKMIIPKLRRAFTARPTAETIQLIE